MIIIVDILILFILLTCLFKISMWKFWQRLVYSLLLGSFAWWSMRYAVTQSKTQLADYLQDTGVIQNMAILVTIESSVGLAFCMSWLNGKRFGYWYPSLLMFPAVFYLLTQTVFMAVGIGFEMIGMCFALAIIILLPLLSEGVRWLLPDDTSRVEAYLLLIIMVCILGLATTGNGEIIYATKGSPIEWHSLLLTFGFFLVLFLVGIIINKIIWTFKNK